MVNWGEPKNIGKVRLIGVPWTTEIVMT